jgi:hypothetical protein
MGIPPCKFILGETMTWHVEHMLDVGSFEVGQGQQTLLEVIVKNLQSIIIFSLHTNLVDFLQPYFFSITFL